MEETRGVQPSDWSVKSASDWSAHSCNLIGPVISGRSCDLYHSAKTYIRVAKTLTTGSLASEVVLDSKVCECTKSDSDFSIGRYFMDIVSG